MDKEYIKNLTAWSIASILTISSITLSLSKNVAEYKEIVIEDEEINKESIIKKSNTEVYISTPMEEYRKYDKDASINVYLYQVKDEVTSNWVTLDIIGKKEYETPPDLLKEGRLVYAGKYDGDDTLIGVYQLEIRNSINDEWTRLDEYSLLKEAPFDTETMRYIYLGENLNKKVLKFD